MSRLHSSSTTTTSLPDNRVTPQTSVDHVLSVTQGNVTFYLGDKNKPTVTSNGTLTKTPINGNIVTGNATNDSVNLVDHINAEHSLSPTPSVTVNVDVEDAIPRPLIPSASQINSVRQFPVDVQSQTNNALQINEICIDVTPNRQDDYAWTGALSVTPKLLRSAGPQTDSPAPSSPSSGLTNNTDNAVEDRKLQPTLDNAHNSGMLADISNDDTSLPSPDKIRKLPPAYRGQDSLSSDEISFVKDMGRPKMLTVNNGRVVIHVPDSGNGVQRPAPSSYQRMNIATNHHRELSKPPPLYTDVTKWDSLSLSEQDVLAQSPPTPPPFCAYVHSNEPKFHSKSPITTRNLPPTVPLVEFYDYGNVGARLATQTVNTRTATVTSPNIGGVVSIDTRQVEQRPSVIAIRTTEPCLADIDEESQQVDPSTGFKSRSDTNHSTLNRQRQRRVADVNNYHYRNESHPHASDLLNNKHHVTNSSLPSVTPFDNNRHVSNSSLPPMAPYDNSRFAKDVHVQSITKRQRYNIAAQKSLEEDISSSKASVYDNVRQPVPSNNVLKSYVQQFSF